MPPTMPIFPTAPILAESKIRKTESDQIDFLFPINISALLEKTGLVTKTKNANYILYPYSDFGLVLAYMLVSLKGAKNAKMRFQMTSHPFLFLF